MNLHSLLAQRLASDRPVRVGVIGAGKFASMFLAQARLTPGLHVMGLCDLEPGRAFGALRATGWPDSHYPADSWRDALENRRVRVTDDAQELISAAGMEVVVDATGEPAAGIRHVLACCAARRHIVMVNVEADVLAGPLLARKAAEAGIVYTLAYGDQPALIAEQVDWARAAGFRVVCAGKGTKYLPAYHASTPDTVWEHYGLSADRAAQGGMNPKMFNSFLDGTKSGIEMAAVANATGLAPPVDGLKFPPCGTDRLAEILKPRANGGTLESAGTVEVVSSLHRDGTQVERDLRWGVYVCFEATSDYAARCLSEYGIVTDSSGRYCALYRPFHLIGLELGISVASAALRSEPTGAPRDFIADVVAIAKRHLAAGEMLDGEGGYTVWGRLTTAAHSLAMGGLPIGLAHGARLKNAVSEGQAVRWADVEVDERLEAIQVRREMERELAPAGSAAHKNEPATENSR